MNRDELMWQQVAAWPKEDPEFRGLLVVKTHREAQSVLAEVNNGFRSKTDPMVNYSSGFVLYPSGARVYVRGDVRDISDTDALAGMRFDDVAWGYDDYSADVYHALRRRIRTVVRRELLAEAQAVSDTPFHGPALKTEPLTQTYLGYDADTRNWATLGVPLIFAPRAAVAGDIYPEPSGTYWFRRQLGENANRVAENITRHNALYRRVAQTLGEARHGRDVLAAG